MARWNRIDRALVADGHRERIDRQPFERIIKELSEGGLSRSTACRMLMARLAIGARSRRAKRPTTPTLSREDKQYG